jgi:phage terminase large subunit-like protein
MTIRTPIIEPGDVRSPSAPAPAVPRVRHPIVAPPARTPASPPASPRRSPPVADLDMARYEHDPVAFIDDFIRVNERGQPFHLFDHQREILRAAFVFDDEGRLPWDTLVYSTRKKGGKTTINAGLTAWWAFTAEAPNELFVLANDQEQAQSRVFSAAARLITRNHQLASSATVEAKRIVLSNDSEIRALASEYAGAAGSNHGLTSWDELWAYSSESARRLWEELTPVPTRVNSIRIVTTYAGFENESDLLRGLYLDGIGPDEHPDGRGERIHPTLPLWLNRAARLLVYWDDEARMPWQTPAYDDAQRRSLRPNAFLRLHRNEWTASESVFITPELWDGATDGAHHPLPPSTQRTLVVGLDLAVKHDTAAAVAVGWDDDQRLLLARHRLWKPSPGAPLDFNAVEEYLRALCAHYHVLRIVVDPYQAASLIQRLAAEGLSIQEFPQTPANLTRAGQALYDALTQRAITLYADAELRQQALNTVAIESERGFRIAKHTAARKIDAIVALAMACAAANELAGVPVLDPEPTAAELAQLTDFTRATFGVSQVLDDAVVGFHDDDDREYPRFFL